VKFAKNYVELRHTVYQIKNKLKAILDMRGWFALNRLENAIKIRNLNYNEFDWHLITDLTAFILSKFRRRSSPPY